MSIIIYTKTGCPWCRDALRFLVEEKVIFEEREVLSNPTYFKELREKSGQAKTPTLDVDGDILPDSDAEAIKAFLISKGIIK